MRANKNETVIFQDGSQARKAFIRDLNIFLTLVILLLSIILGQKVAKYRSTPAIKSQITTAPVMKQAVYAARDVRVRIPILMYHYVENVQDKNDTIRISLNIPPDIFEAQITTLLGEGYVFLTMQDINAILSGTQAPPDKGVVLTFDDGYRTFYEVVFPILKKHNIKAVSFVSPGLLSTPNYMEVNQVIEIAHSGVVEIASHTVNHLSLVNAGLTDARYEIFESKAILEKLIGVPVTNFAYPYGTFDAQAIGLIEEAGYTTAVTTEPGDELTFEDRFILERVRPGRRTGLELLAYLKQTTFTAY